jgi:hypothetical protein
MTAVGFGVAVLLLAVMSVAEVRRVGAAGVVAPRSSSWLLRAELLLMLACAALVLPRAIGLLT